MGTLIINFINIFPVFFTGVLAQRFGNRKMILCGIAGMFVTAVLLTVPFLVDVFALSIVFTALYAIACSVMRGPLVWVITAGLFSIGISDNWLSWVWPTGTSSTRCSFNNINNFNL